MIGMFPDVETYKLDTISAIHGEVTGLVVVLQTGGYKLAASGPDGNVTILETEAAKRLLRWLHTRVRSAQEQGFTPFGVTQCLVPDGVKYTAHIRLSYEDVKQDMCLIPDHTGMISVWLFDSRQEAEAHASEVVAALIPNVDWTAINLPCDGRNGKYENQV